MLSSTALRLLALVAVAISLTATAIWACPFCSAVQQTLSEEIKGADAALIVRLDKRPAVAKTAGSSVPGATPAFEPVRTAFEIVKVLKGESMVAGKKQIEVLYFGQHPVGTHFFVTGVDPKMPAWSTPTMLSQRAADYIATIIKLPDAGADRLAFFQDYFEDRDALLASDAYDEFAKAPYADVQALKLRMPREKLIGWIRDKEVSTSRRRLYLTMLGVCGTTEDVKFLEDLIRNEDRQIRVTLDALVACYLNLKGPDGLPLIIDLFLKNKKAEYTDTYATIMALRFHGTETNVVPREKLLEALRHMLDRPQLADLVIPDLARWEDWGSLSRLVTLFKEAKEDSIWVRVPVVNFLRACPLPEAKLAIDELAKVDPESVKRASQFFPLGGAKPPPSAVRPDDKKIKPSEGKALAPKPVAEPPKASTNSAAATSQRPQSLDVENEIAPALAIAPDVLAAVAAPSAPALPSVSKVAAVGAAPVSTAVSDTPARATWWQRGSVLLWAALSTAGLMFVMFNVLRG